MVIGEGWKNDTTASSTDAERVAKLQSSALSAASHSAKWSSDTPQLESTAHAERTLSPTSIDLSTICATASTPRLQPKLGENVSVQRPPLSTASEQLPTKDPNQITERPDLFTDSTSKVDNPTASEQPPGEPTVSGIPSPEKRSDSALKTPINTAKMSDAERFALEASFKTLGEAIEAYTWTDRPYFAKCRFDGIWYPRPCQIDWDRQEDGFELLPNDQLKVRGKLDRLRPRRKDEEWLDWLKDEFYLYLRFFVDYFICQEDPWWSPSSLSRLEYLSHWFIRKNWCEELGLSHEEYTKYFLIGDVNRDRECVARFAPLCFLAMSIKYLENSGVTPYSKMFLDLFGIPPEKALNSPLILRLTPPSIITPRPRKPNRRREKHIWIVVAGLERDESYGLAELHTEPEDLDFAGGYKPEDGESDDTDDDFFSLDSSDEEEEEEKV
ncbi:hypothetical protein BJ508DRAFT_364184 [Ascobolus immersus RN42]|uniref:Uncharacterized protein n=1 Tax=Ascobolus immersus RN42 TaxID=1160509 RepID=A0A3N4HZK2_ASCIM|nr:hypothetical protein BJ508DRAFT_364184 [Ascobolus immersus RN42]